MGCSASGIAEGGCQGGSCLGLVLGSGKSTFTGATESYCPHAVCASA